MTKRLRRSGLRSATPPMVPSPDEKLLLCYPKPQEKAHASGRRAQKGRASLKGPEQMKANICCVSKNTPLIPNADPTTCQKTRCTPFTPISMLSTRRPHHHSIHQHCEGGWWGGGALKFLDELFKCTIRKSAQMRYQAYTISASTSSLSPSTL